MNSYERFPFPLPSSPMENLTSNTKNMSFEKESTESIFSCITSASFTSHHSPQQHTPKINNGNSTCFNCKKPGHWAKDCPDKTPKKSSDPYDLPKVLGTDGWLYQPLVICPCGEYCKIRISNSASNPGKEYWSCQVCRKFVGWVENGRNYQILYLPFCKCKAGASRVFTETVGPDAGLSFYVCHVKKGQGACAFRRPVDAPVTTVRSCVDKNISSPTPNCDDTSPASSELADEGECSHKGVEIESPAVHTPQYPPSHRETESPAVHTPQYPLRHRETESPVVRTPYYSPSHREIESSAVHTPQYHPSQGAVSGHHPKRGKNVEVESEGETETSNEPSRKLHKRLRHGGAKIDCTFLDVTNEWVDLPEIDRTEAEFMSQISIEGLPASSASAYTCSFSFGGNLVPSTDGCLVTTAISQNLGFPVHDWWGRIGFPPSRCLRMPAPKPFFCCVFPSFDPVLVPQNVDPFDGEASSVLPLSLSTNNKVPPFSLGQDVQLSNEHWDSSTLEWLPETEQGSVMGNVVYKGFAQLAMHLQKQLLMVLESKDFHDHESMVNEASTTFAALKQLSSIDSRPFCRRVREFITCASSLSEIELHVKNDQLSEEIVDRYNREKKRLEEISCEHAVAMADLEASSQRLISLDEKAADLKKILFEIEAEISCCKVENGELERRFVEISKEKVELERGFLVASVAAEDVLKLHDRREEDRRVAHAAFKKAKLLLRQ